VGYLPFFEANDSDHQGLFIDISNAILDYKIEFKRPLKRMISSSSKGTELSQYKYKMDSQCELRGLFTKPEEAFASTFLTREAKTLPGTLDQIDSMATAFALRAKRKCCPKHYDTEWSLSFHNQSIA
jgi:hypothetical protein